MDPRTNKTTKKTYFNSPKKEPLVKKMIFDPHQVHVPSSCFELRPIHEGESNQQEIIFDPKSSSLREISEFDKNSPHELDRMIYGHNENSNQSDHSYIDCDRGQNSAQFNFKANQQSLSQSQSYHPVKRENPIPHEQTKKYENITKIVQISEASNQSSLMKEQNYDSQKSPNNPQFFHSPARKKQITMKNWISLAKSQRKAKWPSRAFNSSVNQDRIFTEDMEENFEDHKQTHENLQIKQQHQDNPRNDEVKIQEVSPELNVIDIYLASEKKTVRKKVDNPEFQLINQYMELASYAALIDEMIFIYDKSPLFEFPLDFDSETEKQNDENEPQEQKQNQQAEKSDKQEDSMQPENEVKIQHMEKQSDQNQKNHKNRLKNPSISKSERELYTQLEKMKLQEAADEKDKQRIIKEINFNRSKTYYNFYEPIKQLKPYLKKMTLEEKRLFLAFKKELKEIKDIIDYFSRKNQGDKREHICKLCGEEFESGRQLGGHMSRKHPGKAIEYGFKKELHKVKEIERNRRKYFKELEDAVKKEHKEN